MGIIGPVQGQIRPESTGSPVVDGVVRLRVVVFLLVGRAAVLGLELKAAPGLGPGVGRAGERGQNGVR